MTSAYTPERGDLIWLSFDPQAGREQRGRRPALVLSPQTYNARAGLALICPITSKTKGYPFEVRLPAGLPIEGVILSDHLKSADWRMRGAQLAGRAPEATIREVTMKIAPLLGLS